MTVLCDRVRAGAEVTFDLVVAESTVSGHHGANESKFVLDGADFLAADCVSDDPGGHDFRELVFSLNPNEQCMRVNNARQCTYGVTFAVVFQKVEFGSDAEGFVADGEFLWSVGLALDFVAAKNIEQA